MAGFSKGFSENRSGKKCLTRLAPIHAALDSLADFAGEKKGFSLMEGMGFAWFCWVNEGSFLFFFSHPFLLAILEASW